MGTLPTHLSGSWTWAVVYMATIYTIPRHLTVIQLLRKVLGVNSQTPKVHVKAGVSLLELQVSLLFVLTSQIFKNFRIPKFLQGQ